MNNKREIKLKRALILGNFYNQQVQIIQMINGIQEGLIDTIVGLKTEYVITRKMGAIPRQSIKNIYKL